MDSKEKLTKLLNLLSFKLKHKDYVAAFNLIYDLKLGNLSKEQNIENILSTTSFDHLKNLENKGLFNENVYDSNKNKIRFFNKGPSNDWTKVLDKKIQGDIEKIFYKEMKELGYI